MKRTNNKQLQIFKSNYQLKRNGHLKQRNKKEVGKSSATKRYHREKKLQLDLQNIKEP